MHMHQYISRTSAQRNFAHDRAVHGRGNIPVTPEGNCTTPRVCNFKSVAWRQAELTEYHKEASHSAESMTDASTKSFD